MIATFTLVLALCLSALPLAGQDLLDSHTLDILAPRSTSSVPLLLLDQEDPLEGLDIRTTLFVSHPQALALLLRGEVDLLLSGTSQGWENHLDGGPLVVIDTGVWGVSSLVGPPGAGPLQSLKALAGRRIAVPFPGSPLDFQTRAMLALSGVDPQRDVRIRYLTFAQSVPLLLAGEVDAAALPEPVATGVVVSRGFARLLSYADAWAQASGGDPRSPQVSLFALRSWAGVHEETLEELIAAWRGASERVAADPAAVARRFAVALEVAPAVLEQAIGNTLYYVPSPRENRRRIELYYAQVRSYLPGPHGALGRSFFFPLR